MIAELKTEKQQQNSDSVKSIYMIQFLVGSIYILYKTESLFGLLDL